MLARAIEPENSLDSNVVFDYLRANPGQNTHVASKRSPEICKDALFYNFFFDKNRQLLWNSKSEVLT